MSRFISLSSTIRTFAIDPSCRSHGAGRRNIGRNRDCEYSVMFEVGFNRNIAADELDEFQAQGEGDAHTTIFGGAVVGAVGKHVEQRLWVHALVVDVGIAYPNAHTLPVRLDRHADFTRRS